MYFIVRFYKEEQATWLFASGIATGLVIVFKHDVGGYTAIAIGAGLLVAYGIDGQEAGCNGSKLSKLVKRLIVYSLGVALVALPVATYFAVLVGPDMWEDLIVFPATDFRFARIEHYSSLIPGDFHHEWLLQ